MTMAHIHLGNASSAGDVAVFLVPVGEMPVSALAVGARAVQQQWLAPTQACHVLPAAEWFAGSAGMPVLTALMRSSLPCLSPPPSALQVDGALPMLMPAESGSLSFA
jgi:hypothetical protein